MVRRFFLLLTFSLDQFDPSTILLRVHVWMNLCIDQLRSRTAVAILPSICSSLLCAFSYARFSLVASRFQPCSGLPASEMPYVVIRTKFIQRRDQADVHPHLFVRLNEAKRHARRWKNEDSSRQRRSNRFVYSVHKVCLVPDFTTTLWYI